MSTLYGLGVGPGDPELLTIKAWRIIGQVPVIAYPVANGSDSLARRIAAPFIPEDAIEIPLSIPMRAEREPARDAYDESVRLIAAHLDAGKDVAFLCEGDPFFYGSFMYLHERLEKAHKIIVVPGVSSLTACAAAIGRPLAARNDLLKVIPAPLAEDRLKAEIASADAIAIIKVGKHFDKIRDLLRTLRLADRAVIIERATRDDERITPLEQLPNGERPYFSTILIYKGGENWVMRPAIFCRSNMKDLAIRIADVVNGEVIAAKGSTLVPALQIAFREERPIIAILPPPIVIRALAPFIGSKYSDPPVITVTANGQFIIPLLGLNHGAAKLASLIEAKIGGTRVTGTATEVRFRTAIDDAPDGYYLHNHPDYKDFALALLDGEPVTIEGDAPWLDTLPQQTDAPLKITITERDLPGSTEHLVFHAKTLAVGVGCERGTEPDEVKRLIADTLRANGLSDEAVACFASIDLKEDEPAIYTICDNDRLRFFTAEELASQSHRIKYPSEIVKAETGSPSVAEAAALAAAGPDAELIVPKTKSKRATCAIARAPKPILEFAGRPRGRLSVIGLGPGDRSMRSDKADLELYAATDWVGYSLYLDLAADMHHEQVLHPFALGEEEARVRHAIALARKGKQVALLCSGDAGIYAMAALVYELLELEPNRIAVEVIPGISAFQAAAAKAGAMIGHDFCCISLSDLLTPWPVIEKRIHAAAKGDFVIAFYNPRSLRRRDQIERAMEILSQHRPSDTPVVIASNLGRQDEKVAIVPLSDFRAETVDMMTLVMVGSSQSRAFKRGDGNVYAYTPRGYAAKRTDG